MIIYVTISSGKLASHGRGEEAGRTRDTRVTQAGGGAEVL